jgi:tetratricopeptide (TPR) repeat protein
LGESTKALQAYENGLDLFPLDTELRFQRAGLLHRFGRLEEAEALYLNVINVREERHFTSVDEGIASFKARQNLAAVYKDLSDHDRAQEQWRLIVDEVPDYATGWDGLADTLMQLGNYSEAVKAQQERIRLEPGNPSGYHNLGATLLAMKEWKSAANAFRESLRLRPDAAVTWMHLGYAHKEMNDIHVARTAFEEVVRLAPDTAYAQEATEHLKLLALRTAASR